METFSGISKIVSNFKISVIVPVYNVENELSACLDSILNQTYSEIEIIIIDDGSTDSSGLIADCYMEKHSGSVYCFHQTNQGVSAARINGVEKATGDWIGFVDGDDVIEPDMYERMIRNAAKYTADISHCGYQTIVNGGARIHSFSNTGNLIVHDRTSGLKSLIEGSVIEPSVCNKLFRKELFTQVLDHKTDLIGIRKNEDLLMNYYLFKGANLSVYEDFCPYHYMAREMSESRSGFSLYKAIDPIKVRGLILYDAENGYERIARIKFILANMHAYAAISIREEYKKESEEIRNTLYSYKAYWKDLDKRNRILLKLMIVSPAAYQFLYNIYEKTFMKKKYE